MGEEPLPSEYAVSKPLRDFELKDNQQKITALLGKMMALPDIPIALLEKIALAFEEQALFMCA